MENSRKYERSLSVQSRVDIVDLIRMARFLEEEGVTVRSLSQLVASTVALMIETLNSNGKIRGELTLVEAWRELEVRELRQSSLGKRNRQKISTALRFESMREEGIDPREIAPIQNAILDRKNRVRPWEGAVTAGKYLDEIDEAFKRSREESKREALAIAKGGNNLVSGDLIPDRDKEIIERENQPIDLTRLKDRIVKE